ncbi:MAG: alpha/beta hydrolase [Kiritimatiellia bacterium]
MQTAIPLWPDGVPTPDGVIPPKETPQLQLYPVSGAAPTGFVVVCPGGGYARRADHEGEPIARMLNAAGMAAGVVIYRCAPHRFPVPQMDAMRAVRLARANAAAWSLKSDKIGILGFSAGGHLAASVATLADAGDPGSADPVARLSARPDAAILCYPVISFGEWGHRGSQNNLLGPLASPVLADQLSLEKRVDASTPPTFLWHTAEDSAVPVVNSLLFAQALAAHKIPFELHVFPNGGHGLGLAKDDPVVGQWPALCVKWLKTRGF